MSVKRHLRGNIIPIYRDFCLTTRLTYLFWYLLLFMHSLNSAVIYRVPQKF